MAIIFASSERTPEITRAVKAKRLRKIASKIYTDDLRSPPEEVIRRHRLEIVAHFYPRAVITHRSALEGGQITPAGKLHLTMPGTPATVRKLPGLDIRVWRGPEPHSRDTRTPLGQGQEIFTSSQPRAVLENLQIARAHGNDEAKTLSREALEHWMDRYLRIFGLDWLKELRSQADMLAAQFEWVRERKELDDLEEAIQSGSSTYGFASELMRSRASGRPYDPDRINLSTELHARLAQEKFMELPTPPLADLDNRAFWEAYFSNFIEGTKFTVEEARVIVYDATAAKALEKRRPDDAHDIRETYRLIIDSNISDALPKDETGLLELLKRRHARMMASRLNVEPGVFKKINNEVGSRVFVAPELVSETLKRGWLACRDLPSASARAAYILFLVAEVHPFNDGNGRIARLGMNAELEAAGKARIILPTSLRNDYLTVLEALTINRNPEPFVAFVHKLIDVNRRMPFGSFNDSLDHFRKTGALDENQQNYGLLTALGTNP